MQVKADFLAQGNNIYSIITGFNMQNSKELWAGGISTSLGHSP